MLHTIRQKHILIVESGCTGTFPMLLMALDAWEDGQCDVRICTDEGIKERAMAEIRTMLPSGKEEL